jgi:hypothetical protein
MKHLVCLLEEPSAEEMLKGVLKNILLKDIIVHYMVFEGKQDLERRLVKRMQYWQKPDSVFLVMRDKDSGDCKLIKQGLLDKVTKAEKQDVTIIRIACHELESFYLGDLFAVEKGLVINGLSRRQQNQKYRTPDVLANASDELSKLTKKTYQKIGGSRAIAPYLKIDGSNTSHSFNILLEGLKKLSVVTLL